MGCLVIPFWVLASWFMLYMFIYCRYWLHDLCYIPYIAGIGFSLMYVPSVTILPFVFDKNIVLAAAASTFPLAIALMVFPYLFMYWLYTYGWRHSLILIACLTAQATVAAALLPSLPQGRVQKAVPHAPQKVTRTRTWTCPVVLQPINICLYLTSGMGLAGNSIIFTLAADYVLACGFTIEYASLALLLFGVGSLAIRFVIAALGRPLRKKSVYMQTASIAIRSIASFGLPFAKTFTSIGVAMVVFGVGWGIHLSLFTTVANDIVGKTHVALVIGLISFTNGTVMFLTPLAASKSLNYTFSDKRETSMQHFVFVIMKIIVFTSNITIKGTCPGLES